MVEIKGQCLERGDHIQYTYTNTSDKKFYKMQRIMASFMTWRINFLLLLDEIVQQFFGLNHSSTKMIQTINYKNKQIYIVDFLYQHSTISR